MRKSLLDTDICSYYLKGNDDVIEKVVDYLTKYPTLNISSITYYEILKGLEYKQASSQKERFENLVEEVNIINVNQSSLKISAKIYGYLRRNGQMIGVSDTLIAGLAIEKNLQLITNNTKHFENIENLDLENWKSN